MSETDVRKALAALNDEQLLQTLTPSEYEALQFGYRERVTDMHLPHIQTLPQVLPGLFADAAARAREAGFERFALPPAEIALDLRRIDRVAAIMAGAIGHVRDLRFAFSSVGERPALVDERADRLHDMDVLALGVAADVVDLADAADLEHAADRGAMILDVQPVAHVASVAVDRQRLAGERLLDHQRNEFLGKLVRPIVVRAVRRQRRQSVRVMERAHEMIGRGLRRRVRGVRLVRRFLGEAPDRAERAVHLVGGDVQEAERILPIERQRAPVCERGFEQRQRADDVRLHELGRTVDRTVDVRLGREVHDRVRLMLAKEPLDERAVADVAVREDVVAVVAHGSQRVKIAGVRQLVEIDDALAAPGERIEHEVRADEAGAAGDEKSLHVIHAEKRKADGSRLP